MSATSDDHEPYYVLRGVISQPTAVVDEDVLFASLTERLDESETDLTIQLDVTATEGEAGGALCLWDASGNPVRRGYVRNLEEVADAVTDMIVDGPEIE